MATLPFPNNRKKAPRLSLIWLGALTGLFLAPSCGLVHIHPDAHPGRLSAAEESVQIFFKDQKLPCDNYTDLGPIQAASGEELEQGEEQEEYATFDAAIAWLKKDAYKRGASAVIILDRKESKDKTTYFVTGIAIRCAVKST